MLPTGLLCQHRNILHPWQLHYQSCFGFEFFFKSHSTLWVKQPPLPQMKKLPQLTQQSVSMAGLCETVLLTETLMVGSQLLTPLAATAMALEVWRAEVAFSGPDTADRECWGRDCSFISL